MHCIIGERCKHAIHTLSPLVDFFQLVELVSVSLKYTGSGSGSHPCGLTRVGGKQGTDTFFGFVVKELI